MNIFESFFQTYENGLLSVLPKWVEQVNCDIVAYLQSYESEFLEAFLGIVSDLISPTVLAVIALIIYWSKSKKTGIELSMSIVTAVVVNSVLKFIFRVPRPFDLRKDGSIIGIDDTEGYSFPSGHSQQAGTYAVFFYKGIKKKALGLTVGIIIVVLTMVSRMYLGMHTLMDVTVGAFLGVVVTAITVRLNDYAERKNKPWLLYIIVIISATAMILSGFDKDLVTMTALSFGAVTGYLIDLKYIGYKIPEKIGKKVLAILLGFTIVGVAKLPFFFIESKEWYIRFLDYGIFGLAITAAAPYLIKKLITEKGE